MKIFKKITMMAVVIACSFTSSWAFDLSKLGSVIGNNANGIGSVINSVLSSDSITIADIKGAWTYCGPAVSFQSDNLLEKAGGAAAAATIESRLQPYYTKAGIDGLKLTFDGNGNVTALMKNGHTMNGTVKQGAKAGQLIFNFSRLGSKYANMTVYVTKGTELSIMLDVTKLQVFLSTIARYSGNSTADTVSGLLSNYKGIYAGFKMKK